MLSQYFSVFTDYWKMKVESYRDWFLEQDKALESVSNYLAGPTDDINDTVNSFRGLEID